METDKIWFKDIQNFITRDNFLEFFPTSDMNYTEQINVTKSDEKDFIKVEAIGILDSFSSESEFLGDNLNF